MRRLLIRFVVAAGLVTVGWVAGHAQAVGQPQFVIRVDAPSGETVITCERGCQLNWVERGLNPNAVAQRTFSYSCSGARCGSGAVGGWIQ
jgi:hypothetical protein